MPESPAPQTLNDLLPTTPDLRQERLDELKRLFPDLFTNEGRLDPDELKRLVSPNEIHENERYEFKWYGKAASKREAFTPTTATLVYDEARSVNPDKADGNMIIEGENLETLKLLLSAYREQVKVIYIDPPYNTGKDFIYKDNYAKDKKSYWEETEITVDGVKLESNPDSSGRFHSNWLSMMQSRLLVARQLLSESGVLFISCDDNEVENLRRLSDEIFGPENFMAQIIWKSRAFPDARAKTGISTDHEYVLLFRKSENGVMRGVARDESKFANPDNDPRGTWMSRSMLGLATKEQRPNLHYTITDTETGISFNPPANTGWRYSPVRMEYLINDQRILFPRNPEGRPREKKFRADIEGDFVAFPTIIDDVHTADGTKEIRDVFGDTIFDFAKPSELIARLVEQIVGEGDLILDFFAGSGSTGVATHRLLSGKSAIKCRSILVQLPEISAPDSVSARVGFSTISAITIERLKRVIQGYGDNPQPLPDTGFKVYKLAKSNFPRCEFTPDPKLSEEENVAALKRYIHEKESASLLPLDDGAEQAVFDEVLLKCGFQLHYTRTRREDFTENTVYEVTDGKRTTLVCLAWNEGIKDTTIKRLRELEETKENPFFICLERSLTTTSKWNLNHLLGKRLTAF